MKIIYVCADLVLAGTPSAAGIFCSKQLWGPPRLLCWPTHAEAVLWDVPTLFTVSSFMLMRLKSERKEAERERDGKKTRIAQLLAHMIANDKHSHAAEACRTEQLYKHTTWGLVTHGAKPGRPLWVSFMSNRGLPIQTRVWPTIVWCHPEYLTVHQLRLPLGGWRILCAKTKGSLTFFLLPLFCGFWR